MRFVFFLLSLSAFFSVTPNMHSPHANPPVVQQQQPAAIAAAAAAAAYAATAQAHVGELDIFSDFLSAPPTPRGAAMPTPAIAPATPLPHAAAAAHPATAAVPAMEAGVAAKVSGGPAAAVDMFAPSPGSDRAKGLSTGGPSSARKQSLSVVDEERKKWETDERCDRLRVVVCSARNVMAKSYFSYVTRILGGLVSSSDCQCVLKFGSREQSTVIAEGTVQPTWNMTVDFNYDVANPQHERLHVEVIHAGLLGPKLLGCVDIVISSLGDSSDRCVTKWFELQAGPDSKDRTRYRGEILLSILRHPVRFHPTSSKLPPVIDPEQPDKRIPLQ
jgi:hypothetical protein